jgi:serine phosphatase RsbU (regulator of sigma subunit)
VTYLHYPNPRKGTQGGPRRSSAESSPRMRQLIPPIRRVQRDELALELKHAAEAQQRLLPQVLADVPGMQFAGLMSPSKELGGDYHDFIQLPHGDIGLVVADVSGKGAEAALFMPSIEVALRMDTHSPSPTDEVIRNLNRVLHDVAGQTRYVTMFYSRLDVASRTLHYTNAGHPPPCILRGSDAELWLTEGGPVVGLLPDASYQAADVALLPGDILILYTDGVIEPENARGEQFSTARLVEVARTNRERPAQDLIRATHSAVVAFSGTNEPSDDLTLLLVTILPDDAQSG